MIVQFIIVAVLLAAVLYLFLTPSSASRKAWLRIAGLIFLVVFIAGFFFPDITARLASWLGVKSGTELLVYAMFIGWVASSLIFYSQILDMRRRQARLIQQIAIQGAVQGTAPSAGTDSVPNAESS